MIVANTTPTSGGPMASPKSTPVMPSDVAESRTSALNLGDDPERQEPEPHQPDEEAHPAAALAVHVRHGAPVRLEGYTRGFAAYRDRASIHRLRDLHNLSPARSRVVHTGPLRWVP
jgi:hypothetical protein